MLNCLKKDNQSDQMSTVARREVLSNPVPFNYYLVTGLSEDA